MTTLSDYTASEHTVQLSPIAVGLLRASTERIGPVCVVRVEGEVDLGSAEVLRSAVDEALAAEPDGLVVDLSAVRFLGSTGLSILVHAYDTLRQRGAGTRIVATRREVLRPLQLTGLSDVMPVHPTTGRALRDVRRPA
ncbi:anti-sigma B factor antagonist [Amycolatopsis arida]|uniref:Anti-sigma factor antagonist n=1 Tax=Amycolatopsis arida TaxID=587909 RepID=A0A1I5YV88_9PSEU|nr:anti-sigma factor antagonist [Amycolatopsis arida]TDX89916.1 anti-sigma B factor antagonist [Amycolatopsis arida]SFQ48183.1 anti-sigma B factor antagonist [Amycolatopsis arida]